MPFNLFISAHRRKMIIDAMMKSGDQQKEGERIMQNYKKQLAERYAQMRIDRNMGQTKSQNTNSSKPKSRRGNRDSQNGGIGGNDQMADPEVLKAILNRKDPGL